MLLFNSVITNARTSTDKSFESYFVCKFIERSCFANINQTVPVLETMNDETLSAKQLVSVASEGFNRSKEPLRHFLIRHANNSEKALFVDISKQLHQELADEITPNDFSVLVPAFVITELKEAFSIGFLVFVPFLLIDIIIGNILLSLGMHMMSPTVVSLPFKLLLFVMVDGWQLLTKGLLLGYV